MHPGCQQRGPDVSCVLSCCRGVNLDGTHRLLHMSVADEVRVTQPSGTAPGPPCSSTQHSALSYSPPDLIQAVADPVGHPCSPLLACSMLVMRVEEWRTPLAPSLAPGIPKASW